MDRFTHLDSHPLSILELPSLEDAVPVRSAPISLVGVRNRRISSTEQPHVIQIIPILVAPAKHNSIRRIESAGEQIRAAGDDSSSLAGDGALGCCGAVAGVAAGQDAGPHALVNVEDANLAMRVQIAVVVQIWVREAKEHEHLLREHVVVVLREHGAEPRTRALRNGVPTVPGCACDDCMRIPTRARRIPLGDAVAPTKAEQGVLWVGERTQDRPCHASLRLQGGGHLRSDFRPGGLGVLDILGDRAVDLQLPELVPSKQL